LGGLNSFPGTRLATIGNMPDLPQSPELISEDESSPESPPNKKRGWLVIVLVLVLGVVGGVVWLVSGSSATTAEGAAETTLALDTFVVNLTGSSQRAYLRVGITLGLARPLPRNQADAAPIALIRDTMLSVLATSQPEDLLRADGKRQLKDALLKALQEHVPQIAVQNVYFTEFLVQM
jgi:flagellar basal body-associated protein FliL